jgi:two-component system nitrate/nitrite response regulator NarL
MVIASPDPVVISFADRASCLQAFSYLLQVIGATILDRDIGELTRGRAGMNHNVVYKNGAAPVAQDLFQNVTTVLICQNVLLRTGISHILSGTRFSLTEEAHEDLSSLPAFDEKVPLLFLVCDSRSPEEHASTIRDLKAQYPSARVVVLADAMEPQAVAPLCQAGLAGVCLTQMERHALVKALELVMLGEIFIPGSIGLELIERMRREQPAGMPTAFMAANDPAILLKKLSEREAQILRCLTQGASNKLIARELGVAEATVKVHIKAILRKVKATNRTQAAMLAAGHFNALPENRSSVGDE